MRRRVRVVAAALALVVVAIDLPAVAAAEPPQPDAAAQAADAGPAPESEPRDLQKELSGGTARVEVEANLPNKEKSEEPEKVDELVQYRSEGSETWTTTDGANVTEFFGEQKWYRDSKGEWAEVDPKLVANDDGSVSATGVGFGLWIGPSQEGVRLSFEGREISFRLFGREGVRPELDAKDSKVVWLRGVWDGVDARYTVSASGLKEDFVVASPEALRQPGIFASSLDSEGVLVADKRRPGGQVLDWDADGKTAVEGDDDGPKMSLSPPIVADAKGALLPEAEPVLVTEPGKETDPARRSRLVGVGVDADVLSQLPADSYPLIVDPSIEITPSSMGGSWASYNSAGNISLGMNQWAMLGNWRLFNADDWFRFNVQPGYQYLWTNVAANAQVFSANLRFTALPEPTNVWPFQPPSSWPTSSTGLQVGACHASAWSYAGAYPGFDPYKCRAGYYYGFIWADSILNGYPNPANPNDYTNIDVTNMIRPWVAAHDPNGVLGVSMEQYAGWYSLKATAPTLIVFWDTPSPAVGGMTPANGATMTNQTPTLSWGTVTDPDAGQSPQLYRAVLFGSKPTGLGSDPTTNCNSNQAIWSTPYATGTSVNVPAGILQDGVTYSWTVASMGSTVPGYPTCAPLQEFKVDRRLGATGPSPVESIGPVSVNLATGNVVAGAGTHTVSSVGGDIGLQFAYNSQNKPQNGLRAQFFMGTYPPYELTPTLAWVDPFLARVDASVDYNWGTGGPAGAELDNFLGRWSGYVTAPVAGSYCFGANADSGRKITVGGTVVLSSLGGSGDMACTTSVSFAAGETKQIVVEYYHLTGAAHLQLKTYGASPVTGVVPSSWLTTDIPVLGPGWTMSDGDVSVSGARNTGAGVTLTMGDGSTVEYKRSDTGAYVGPPGDGTVVRVDPISNQIVVVDDAGTTYTYSSEGELKSAVAAVDDRNPAAKVMTWSTGTARLTTITDPVSGRAVTLTYGGGTCTSPPAGYTIAAGQLCKVESWDNRVTDLFYKQGRLEQIVNPGGVRTLFTYDGSNQLTSVTEPLANDAIDAGVRANDASATWEIAYTSGKATTITAPAPTAGATRQTFTVNYDSTAVVGTPGVSRVTASGLSAPNGYTKKVAFDTSYRTVSTWDDNAQKTDITYDGTSDRVSYTDTNVGTAQAMRSSTVYDTSVVFNGLSRPIATYGPAPVASFTGATPNVGAVVPTTLTSYDDSINGLAAAWWDDTPGGGEVYNYPDRPSFRGAPKLHTLFNPSTLGANWGTSAPDPTLPADNFSLRLTGLINMATAGNYQFGTWGAQGTRVTIDDKQVLDGWRLNGGTLQSAVYSLTSGWHRVTVEARADQGSSAFDVTWKTPGSGSFANIPLASLKPDLGLVTTSTTNSVDGSGASTNTVTTTAYADPIVGNATSTVTDPSGLKLTSAATFETKGATGSFLRKTSSTLPAGFDAAGAVVNQPGGGAQAATTTYGYYTATEAGPTTTGCSGVATNQAGLMKSRTKANPDGTGPIAALVDEFAYDTSGRTVGTRTVGDSAWSCTTYDSRGRTTTQTYPTFTNPADATLNTPARTVTTAYSVSSNPLKTKVTDSTVSGDLITTVDLRGRVTDYTDSSGYTTNTVYDTAGRVTTVTVRNPSAVTVETLTYTYNTSGSGVNELATVSLDGVQQASVAYDAIGRPSGYTYANGTTGTPTYDATYQRQTDLSFALGATPITSDSVTRDPRTGMIVDQSVDGVDANPSGANYGYDKAGRLTSWWQRDPSSGNRYQGTYSFTGYSGTAPGCGNTQWGRNSNRLSFTRSAYNSGGGLISTYTDNTCYDNADRLTSYLPASGTNPYAGVTYDSHGNTIKMGGEIHSYDSADRHLTTTAPIASGKNALLVVGNPGSMGVRDTWLQTQLVNAGWTVTVGDDDAVTSASANGQRLIVLSESVTQAGVSTKFTSVAVPVITAEPFLTDELGMTGTGTNQGGTSGSTETQVAITAAGAAHPLGAGFTAGNTTIASPGVDLTWGKPNSNALVAATLVSDSTKAVVYGYQTGAQMVSGTAPAPRATWAHYTTNSANLNANAVTLFNAVVNWATTTQVSYTRDAADRITKRTVNGTTAAKYAYTAADDSPELTLDNSGAVIEKTISLPGGVLVTKRGSAANDVWSYPNLHGDIAATTNGSGTKSGSTRAYDPFGPLLGATVLPDNSTANLDYAWHGQQQRPLEHETGLQPLIEMGARQYATELGRFLELDPVEGGTTTNDYGYMRDPLQTSDLTGQGSPCSLSYKNPRSYQTCMRRTRGIEVKPRYKQLIVNNPRTGRVTYKNVLLGYDRVYLRDFSTEPGPHLGGGSIGDFFKAIGKPLLVVGTWWSRLMAPAWTLVDPCIMARQTTRPCGASQEMARGR